MKEDGKITIENHMLSGGLWIVGWLFTIGFLGLSVKQGIYAIVIWPYYVGDALAFLLG